MSKNLTIRVAFPIISHLPREVSNLTRPDVFAASLLRDLFCSNPGGVFFCQTDVGSNPWEGKIGTPTKKHIGKRDRLYYVATDIW